MTGKFEALAILDRVGEAGDLFLFALRADDVELEAGGKRRNRADMVVMVVRDEDMAQGPAAPLERFEDRAFFRRIDGRRQPGFRIVDEDAEIVRQAGEEIDIQRSHLVFPVVDLMLNLMAHRLMSTRLLVTIASCMPISSI